MSSSLQRRTLAFLVACGTAWSFATPPPSASAAAPAAKHKAAPEPQEEGKGPKRQRPDAPGMGSEAMGGGAPPAEALPDRPRPKTATGATAFTHEECERIDRLRAREGTAPTPLRGVLQALKDNEDIMAPGKWPKGPHGDYHRIPWLNNYILKTGDYDRLRHADQIREAIDRYGCHSFFVPEKVPYLIHDLPETDEQPEGFHTLTYIVEKIEGRCNTPLSRSEVIQLHKIVLATRFLDFHDRNFIRTKDGRIAFIDTGWQGQDDPREKLVAEGLFNLMNMNMTQDAKEYIEGELANIWPSFERFAEDFAGGDCSDYAGDNLHLKNSPIYNKYNYLQAMAKDFGAADDHDPEGHAIDLGPPVRDAYARAIAQLPAHDSAPGREAKAPAPAPVSPATPPEAGAAPLLEAIRSFDPGAVRRTLRDFPTLSPAAGAVSPLEAALDHAPSAERAGREPQLREVVEALLEAMVLWTPSNQEVLQQAFHTSMNLDSPYFHDRIGKHMHDHGFEYK
jgi:hypothetical protein